MTTTIQEDREFKSIQCKLPGVASVNSLWEGTLQKQKYF